MFVATRLSALKKGVSDWRSGRQQRRTRRTKYCSWSAKCATLSVRGRCRLAAVAATAAISTRRKASAITASRASGVGLHIPEGLAHHEVFGRLLDLDTVIFGKADRRRILNPVHQADFVHVDDDLFAGG